MSELKPCPFCGGEAVKIYTLSDCDECWVCCHECGAESGGASTDKEAIEAWNRVSDAVERMKPKKIVSTFWSDSSKGFSELHGRFTCPTCNGELDDYRYDISFCPHEGCGQALDWSE